MRLAEGMATSEDFSPRHISELAGALGTLYWLDGNVHRAKRLFKHALRMPTENTVAQAGWISRRTGHSLIDAKVPDVPRSYEANAWAAIAEGDWEKAADAARLWFVDEPFAKRPAVFASWVALTTLSDFEMAEEFANLGLITHPADPILLNNLAVALAYQGRAIDAQKAFENINRGKLEEVHVPIYLATKGLIRFRLGFPDDGRDLYRQAVLDAKRKGDIVHKVRAILHWAREEARFDYGKAAPLLREADFEIGRLPRTEQMINSRLEELIEKARSEVEKR